MLCSVRWRSTVSSALVLSAVLAATASGVTVDWVAVGDPGNACDAQTQGCFGAVGYAYQISSSEVTNAQYTEFLNAVADEDLNGLYNPSMTWAGSGFGGINRTGSSGSFVYSAAASRENMPVNYVSFYDALRFANWMHNGQPTGAQGNATTENGSYTITTQGIIDNSITRNAGASIVLPTENEWYKAAFYDAVASGFLDYPASSDSPTACADVTGDANSANCENAVGSGTGGLTEVGSYTGSASPAGTFDQGGNLWEWNEAVLFDDFRGLRGGSFNHMAERMAADYQSLLNPDAEANNHGFRIAFVPEPSTALLLGLGLVALAARRDRAP